MVVFLVERSTKEMESSYFKKSPNKLSPSTKPNEMTDSGVTVWLTDGQGTPDEPETPAQMVLRLPEVTYCHLCRWQVGILYKEISYHIYHSLTVVFGFSPSFCP